ncbi:MAG: SpoIIE family protein phosphatase [Methylococcales bacterium]|nr:SpoIIE family protein phosphatase [Methylococcales bacterium]
MKILVVDDTRLTQMMLKRTLEKLGYDVFCVSNIQSALDYLEDESVQFVITDWVMPGGNGPELCRKIRDKESTFYTYIILMTSHVNTQAMVDGMDAGADDFVGKPIQLDELHARIRAGERVLQLEKKLQDHNKKLIDAQKTIHQDLQLASTMQRALLPICPSSINDVHIDGLFFPSAYVSGDIFNFFRLDEKHIGFYSIDVSGHGIAAAMLSFTLSRLLTPDLNQGSPLKKKLSVAPYYELIPSEQVMDSLNRQFQTDASNTLYFTMVYGVMNTETLHIDLCQAGHPPPIYLPKEGAAKFIGDGGFPVGITDIAEFESIDISFGKQDRLYIYSDGISECMDAEEEMFGSDRLLSFFEETRDLPTDEVTKQLENRIRLWQGTDKFEDDVSLLVIEGGRKKC